VAKIAVIGSGYVGLTTGACLAELGHDVVCIDIDVEKVEQLSRGKLTIFEDGLEALVKNGIKNKSLKFAVDAKEAVANSEFIYFCLPTPESRDGSADISAVKKVATDLGPFFKRDSVIVNKSTLPVGSVREVEKWINRNDIHVVSNPEFLREGSAVGDFMNPDRVVIGADNRAAAERVAQIYEPICSNTIITDPASAETIKYAANAFLAARLSFVNALAAVCEVVGANVADVVAGLGSDSRIGPQFLSPGPGWGGSCFPKDTKALLKIAQENGYDFELLAGVISANESQIARIAERIATQAKTIDPKPTVAVWGLTFKAGTDDLRESPSLKIVELLLRKGVAVQAYDPTQQRSKQIDDKIGLCDTAVEACKGAHLLAVLTEWSEFKRVDPKLVAKQMKGRAVFDGRNILNEPDWISSGFELRGVGR